MIEVYTIKLTDGTIQTYSTNNCRIGEGERGMTIFETETWRETYIPFTSILYYRKEREDA